MTTEAAIIGALLEVNGDCPPNLLRLLHNAPESFDDRRCGLTAVAIRDLRADGQAVHAKSVNDLLTFPDSLGFVLQAQQSALSTGLAELEATSAWESFQARQTAKLFSEAAEALSANPEQATDIRFRVIAALHTLDADMNSLEGRLFNSANPPPEPTTVFSIGSTGVCTAGNIATISAQVKSGKSAVIGAALAATFAGEYSDCLGFISGNPQGRAVISVDIEQSPFDHHQLISRSIFRAGAQAKPEWLLPYCLTGFKADEIRRSIRHLLLNARKKFGGVLALLIDGVADAVNDVNDPAEANAFVAELHALAIEFNCAIVAVIHLNPGSDFKTRGHLGSQLERKAETNLRLEKEADGTITLFADKNRRAPIGKATGPRFRWSDEAKMHVSSATQRQTKDDLEREDLENLFIKIFSERQAMPYADLKITVTKRLSVSGRTAERKIARADMLKVIRKTFANLYEIVT